jgi:hypothetical protein
MTNMTREQLEQVFRRQVRLCSGIGHARMEQIVREEYADASRKHQRELNRVMYGSLCDNDEGKQQ